MSGAHLVFALFWLAGICAAAWLGYNARRERG
jgi:hypothetical protein